LQKVHHGADILDCNDAALVPQWVGSGMAWDLLRCRAKRCVQVDTICDLQDSRSGLEVNPAAGRNAQTRSRLLCEGG
jgi:hypothetical protein